MRYTQINHVYYDWFLVGDKHAFVQKIKFNELGVHELAMHVQREKERKRE